MANVLEGDGAPDSQAGVPTGRQIARHRTGGDNCVVNALVAVAVDEHRLARTQQRHEHGLVRCGGTVRHIAALRGTEDFARELLGLGERGVAFGARQVAQ